MDKLNRTFIGTGDVGGFEFTLEAESPFAYMFRVDTGISTHYEVFMKKTVKKAIDWENRIFSDEDKEIYPKSKDFGFWAWTYPDKVTATIKFFAISTP